MPPTAAGVSSILLLSFIAGVVVRGQQAHGAAQALIDGTDSPNVFHLDLFLQPARPSSPPWFGGFGEDGGDAAVAAAAGTAVVTMVHPIRRMLLHLRQEGVGLKEGISWAERGGKAATSNNSYRQGYQLVDNYLVRVLAGKSAWELPPGRVGGAELQAARIALGKFEVVLRADCLAVDLPLLQPYLARPVPDGGFTKAARETEELLAAGDAHYLVFGKEGYQLLRDNRFDLQLWDFAHKLVEARSPTKEGYLCGSSRAARHQRMPGEGKRAAVYNSPSFHITGVAMFSCVLMSLGFDVTAVIKDPGAGFQHLLPCPDRVVTLDGHYLADVPGEILDEETAAGLGLSAEMTAEQRERQRRQQWYYQEYQRKQELKHEQEAEKGDEGQEDGGDAQGGRQDEEREGRKKEGTETDGSGVRQRGRRAHTKRRARRGLSGVPGGGGGDGVPSLFEGTGEDVQNVGVGVSWIKEGRAEQATRPGRWQRRLAEIVAAGSGELPAAAPGAEKAAGAARGDGGGRAAGAGLGAFDLSVLCTAVNDINHLMKPKYPVDPRLVDALLWDVDISIWNLHSVEGAFRSEDRLPAAVEDYVRGIPSMAERGGGGRMPPSTFLTLYGEHVEQWDRWSEEAYEGWGWDEAHRPHSHGPTGASPAAGPTLVGGLNGGGGGGGDEGGYGQAQYPGRGNSTLGAIFRRAGVVYPIHPTGHLRLPRPKRPFRGLLAGAREGTEEAGASEKANKEEVVFVVQGNMQSNRRDYLGLTRCLEAMCLTGRENYRLLAVGARGDLPDEMKRRECVQKRTTELRHLEYPEFYGNVSAGHFVVTAAAGHDYEFDKATSTVPTALLLERPLVMSSSLLDAYPCLRRCRVHSMVANDDLCLSLQAAYDLTTDEYDEMELEARDCKLEMWRHARETVAGMASGWTLD